MAGKRFDRLVCTDGLTFGRWTCDLRNLHDGPEHETDRYTVNVPLRGAFVRRGTGGTDLVDPLTCSFANVGDVWCSRHPEPCRDTGLYVTLTQVDEPFAVPFRRLTPAAWLAWRRLAAQVGDLPVDAAEDAVLLLLERQLQAPASPTCPELVRDARARLARGDVRNVEALAEALGVSRFTLCRAFRRASAPPGSSARPSAFGRPTGPGRANEPEGTSVPFFGRAHARRAPRSTPASISSAPLARPTRSWPARTTSRRSRWSSASPTTAT